MPSSDIPEGSYDILAPGDEPQGQSAPPQTQDEKKGKVLQPIHVCSSGNNK